MIDRGVDVGVEAVLVRSVKRICTIDLMLLKPYFQGTMRRSGAPSWLGRVRP